MTKTLADLLGKTAEETSKLVHKLESLSGNLCEDVRLVTEVRAKTKEQLISLGLDPQDTTPRELRQTLVLKADKDNRRFESALGTFSLSDEKLARCLTGLAGLSSKKVWVLKKTVAKNIVRQSPPKRLMKLLGYRSVESMLRREDISEILASLPFVESKRWNDNLWKNFSKLKPSDFEDRRVEFLVMAPDRWGSVTPRAGLVSCILPLGVAAVWPKTHLPHRAITLSVLLFEAMEVMSVYSVCLKLEQVKPDFGQKVTELMKPRIESPVRFAGSEVYWDSLHRHFGRQGRELPEFFNPHISAGDFHSKTVCEELSKFHPCFNWWSKNDIAAYLGGSYPASLNLLDSVVSSITGSSTSYSFKKSLANELLDRYLRHEGVKDFFLSQLDNRDDGNQTGNISARVNKKTTLELIQAEFA